MSDDLQKEIEEIAKNLQNSIENLIPRDFDYKNIYENFQNAIIKISENDWYIDFDMTMSQIIQVSHYFENGQDEQANDLLKNYFDEEIDNISQRIFRKFPKRKKVLQAAINAHKESNYYLSIPIFYAQAEGICEELTNVRFFSVKKGIPKTSEIIEKFDGTNLTLDLLKPLNLISSNRKNQNLENPLGINRHDILHGQSTDYGDDKFNSYKAFSLLNYISDVLFYAMEK